MEEVTIGKARILHGDCLAFMRELPDKFYDLACVDVPYGIERFKKGGSHLNKHGSHNALWNNEKPSHDYFVELFRISKFQIIWGANNFELPATEYFIIWDKPNMPEGMSFASCEYAWTNVKKPAKLFRQHSSVESRIHPTQKPIPLYSWLFSNYAKQGDKIFDSHGGSMSSVIAALNLGFEITCLELDDDYYAAGVGRVRQSQQQVRMFADEPERKPEQASIL